MKAISVQGLVRTIQTDYILHEDLDLELEEILMSVAIWRSIQDLGQPCESSSTVGCRSSGHVSNLCGLSPAFVDDRDIPSADSIKAGLAVAVASMAEHNIQWPEMVQAFKGGCSDRSSSTSEADSYELLVPRASLRHGSVAVLRAGEDIITVIWGLNGTTHRGVDSQYKKVKVEWLSRWDPLRSTPSTSARPKASASDSHTEALLTTIQPSDFFRAAWPDEHVQLRRDDPGGGVWGWDEGVRRQVFVLLKCASQEEPLERGSGGV
ncbi:hypothetical protein ACLOJK_031837 [Asimina triloba]